MSTENKEFYELLESVIEEQVFSFDLFPRRSNETNTITCKQLTTTQLKKMIESVVDSPITQQSFNSAATTVFKESITSPVSVSLNIIDRLLFLIETRIQSLSPTMTVKAEDKTIVVNFEDIRTNLRQRLLENIELFSPAAATEGKITVKFGVPSLETESKLNSEFYKNTNLNIQDPEELRKIIGETFINEIAKGIQSVTIEDKTLDFSTVTFKSQLKTVETLPASIIQKVIEYIEKYKKILDDCLTVEGHTITIDGTLFSLR